jgi:hypothetical protein
MVQSTRDAFHLALAAWRTEGTLLLRVRNFPSFVLAFIYSKEQQTAGGSNQHHTGQTSSPKWEHLLVLGGAQFEFWPVRRISQQSSSVVLLGPSRQMQEKYLKLGHDRFLTHPFQPSIRHYINVVCEGGLFHDAVSIHTYIRGGPNCWPLHRDL